MNIWDILILIAVAALLALAVFFLRKNKAAGGCSSCGSCPYSKTCTKPKTKA